MAQVVFIDGLEQPPERAFVSVFDRGFLYGDSVFETLRTYDGRVFALEQHLERLAASAHSVKIELPVSLEQLAFEVGAAVAASKNAESYVRVMITRGQRGWGLAPDSEPAVGLRVIIVRELHCLPASCYEDGVSAVTFRTQRPNDEVGVQAAKLGNYLVAALAMDAARLAGAHEALIVNAEGCVVEGSTSNLFLVIGDKLCTPPDDGGILQGITRAHLLEVARVLGLELEYLCPDLEQLFTADEMMIASSIRELVPVVRVDGRSIGSGRPGPVARQLLQGFRARCSRVRST
jgi:branched-chain amino acid aminotransferase